MTPLHSNFEYHFPVVKNIKIDLYIVSKGNYNVSSLWLPFGILQQYPMNFKFAFSLRLSIIVIYINVLRFKLTCFDHLIDTACILFYSPQTVLLQEPLQSGREPKTCRFVYVS